MRQPRGRFTQRHDADVEHVDLVRGAEARGYEPGPDRRDQPRRLGHAAVGRCGTDASQGQRPADRCDVMVVEREPDLTALAPQNESAGRDAREIELRLSIGLDP